MRLRVIHPFIRASLISSAFCFVSVSEAKEVAPSAEQIERAAESFDRGRSAYRSGGFIEAAESFEAADSYAPSSASLRLAMLSRARADQLDRALTLAALALSLYPEEAALRKEANELIERHASSLGRLDVRCDSPCKLLLDNKLVHGANANERSLFVTAGKHRVRVNWADGHVKNFGIKIESGATDSIDLIAPTEPVSEEMNQWINSREELPPEERAAGSDSQGAKATSAADTGTSGGWSKAVFWTGVGFTGAGAITSIALGIRAINEPGADAVRENCMGSTDCPEYQEGLRNQTMANVAIGATAAIGVFTLITGIWLTDWSKNTKTASNTWRFGGETEVRPLLGFADGPGLGLEGRF